MSLSFLKPIGEFKYSVNIEYDLQNDKKIKSYIPTSGSLLVIKDILDSVMSNNSDAIRARLLTGAYGKGKSHLTLTILALLSGRDKKLFKNLLDKCKLVDKELYENIKKYLNDGNKLLPVVMNTASSSLKTNFLNSLDIALKENGLDNLMPDTFYDVAISTINEWKHNYPNTYKKMEELLGNGESVIDKLKQYNQETYNNFVTLYPQLTSGSVFNPMVGADTAKLYEKVIKDIKKYGYNGIFLVYDEFGKFLEGSADTKSTADDLKLLQDMAELSARTSRDEQLNLLLISHKGIDNYVSNLPKEKIDNWKAIAGRFYKMSIQSKDEEIYDIISTVLNKDKGYSQFIKEHKEDFDKLENNISVTKTNTTSFKTGAFKDVLNTVGVEFVKKCYPLHPYTLLMLPKISELVAQNERSIFTYLTSSEKNSVTYYIKRTEEDFPIIEPDAIYDYFESLFKGEAYGSPIREQWEIASAAISKLSSCENDLAIKLVKTISLIYIINEFEILPPSSELLYDIYSNYSSIEIQTALEILRKEELLIELEFRPYVKIRKSSNNNIKELLDNEIHSIKDLDVKNILKSNIKSEYFYPVDYNDSQEITRYFKLEFNTIEELNDIDNIDSYIDNIDADGVVIAVLVNNEDDIEEAINLAQKHNSNRVVYIIPSSIKNIEHNLVKYQAVCNLIEKKANDKLLVDEFEYIRQDLYDLIEDFIGTYYLKPESGKIQYIYNGELKNVRRRKNLSTLLSTICEKIFEKTPKIINENINKNNISSTMKTTRRKILEGVLKDQLQPNLNLTGSQNINVLRSVYVVPQVIEDLNIPIINYNNCNAEVKEVLDTIERFILSSNLEKKNFVELYNILVKAKFGYGLKKGIIPFYVAIIIRKYKQRLVIYNKNREQEINADLLLLINENPNQYEVKIEILNEDEESYLNLLENTFENYCKPSDLEFSRFDYIVKAMQRWYFQLPKYDRETKYYINQSNEFVLLDNKVNKFKSALGNPELNPREFLFDKLTKITKENSYTNIAKFIADVKNIIDKNIDNVICKIKSILMKKLNAKPNASLYSTLQDYYDELKENTQNHVFSNNASCFLDTIRNINNDDSRTIKLMLKNLYSLRINDFTDDLMLSVEKTIDDILQIIQKYNDKDESDLSKSSGFVLRYNNNKGEQELHFDNVEEMNYQANMFYNEILSSIDDFNESLTNAEKAQIMLKIIKELN